MRTDGELSEKISEHLNETQNSSDNKLLSKCTSCGQINSIPPSFTGGRSKCVACGEFLPNPKREKELQAYRQISRGLGGLLIFSILIFAPYAYNFFDLTFVDDEAEVIDGELEREYAHSACEPGENYDEPLCEKEIQWDRITTAGIKALIFLIPIYAIVEIGIGVSKLSIFNSTSF